MPRFHKCGGIKRYEGGANKPILCDEYAHLYYVSPADASGHVNTRARCIQHALIAVTDGSRRVEREVYEVALIMES